MRLTNYTLRALRLAAPRAPAPVRADDVVEVHGLTRPHIVRIVHELRRAGLIETRRGRGGGFRPVRPAAEITVGAVVRLTEGSFDVVACFNRAINTRPPIGICRLSQTIQAAARALLDGLDAVTIAGIAAGRDQLLGRIPPLQEGMLTPKRVRA